MNFIFPDRSGSEIGVSIERISLDAAMQIILSEFDAETLKSCLVDPVNGIDLYAQEWMSDEYCEMLSRSIEAGILESFEVEEKGCGSAVRVVGVRVTNSQMLDFILQVWTTQPIFRGFFGGMTMGLLHSRLSTADAHEFFCENPCDYHALGSRLQIPQGAWILVYDQYAETDACLLIESVS